MKKLRKYLIVIGVLFFGLQNLTVAKTINKEEIIYPYHNHMTIGNKDMITGYKIFNLYCDGYNWRCYYSDTSIKENNSISSPLFLINKIHNDLDKINSSLKFENYIEALQFLSGNDIVIEIPLEYQGGYDSLTGSFPYREIVYYLIQNDNGIGAIKTSVKKYNSGFKPDICSDNTHAVYCDDGDLAEETTGLLIFGISANDYFKKYIDEYTKRWPTAKSQITDDEYVFEYIGKYIYYMKESSTGLFVTAMLDNSGINKINYKLKYKTNKYLKEFFKARSTTIILETLVLIFLFFFLKYFYKNENIKAGKIILTGILASSITLPILRFVLPHIFHNYTVYAIVGEVFVTFVEVFIIKYLLDINRQKATIASIACNLFSVIIGLLL